MKKVGRKQALSPDQIQQLRARLANYYRVRRQDNPKAIADDMGISISAVRAYDKDLHKGVPGQRSPPSYEECDSSFAEEHDSSLVEESSPSLRAGLDRWENRRTSR